MANDDLKDELRALDGADADVSDANLSRARALFATALETPGGLRIQTIHAFCERLLRRFPIEADTAPGFEVVDEGQSEALMAAAWAEIIAAPDARRALAHLARRLDEDALEKLMANVNQRRRILRATQQGLDLPDALAHLRARHGADADRAAFLAAFFADAPWRDLEAAISVLESGTKTDGDAAARIRTASAAPDTFDEYIAIFMTQGGSPRQNLMTTKLRQAHGALDSSLAREQVRVIATIAALKAIDRADDAAALLTLGDHLLRAYAKAKAATGALDFEDLIERAEGLLTSAGAAPWVLFKLDGSIDHILIDEGQDTSPAQWALLEPLQREFFAGVGAREKVRTVFAVGDPKQSIYSFQGADSVRFLSESQNLSARAAAAELRFHAPDMTMSFRSTPTVLAAVDSVFKDAPLIAGEPTASDIIRHDAHRADHVGLVEFWPLSPRAERPAPRAWEAPLDSEQAASAVAVMAEAIARKIDAWIKAGAQVWEKDDTPRALRPGDIIALVRSRGAVFQALLKAFKGAGLPVAGADRIALKDEIAALDLLAFARIALDERDDLSLACALKSPLIGIDEDTLMTLAAGRDEDTPLIARLRADPKLRAQAAFVDSARAARHEAPYAFFARLLELRDGAGHSGWRRMLERLGHAARDPMEELLSRALASGRNGPGDLQHFLCEIDADDSEIKREQETGADAVRVMTVHGAKGLEAPVVILADTTGNFESRDAGLMIGGGEFYWSPNKDSDDVVTAAVRAQTSEAARREHLRLLYVAMTRARDRLIVCGHERGNLKGGRAAGSWHELVEAGLRGMADATAIQTPFGEGLRLGAEAAITKAADAKADAPALPDWLSRPAPPATPPTPSLAPSRLAARAPPAFSARESEQKRFRRGRLIHGLMQRLPDIAPAQRADAARRWLSARMAPGEDADVLIREALAVIDDPRFAAVFAPGSRAETPIVGEIEGHRISGIVDRLVVTDSEVLILDFKTDRPAPPSPAGIAEPYLAQLGLYRAVLAKALPGRTIRCALLWTEAPALMEADPAAMARAVAALIS